MKINQNLKIIIIIFIIALNLYFAYGDSSTADTMYISCNYSGGTGATVCSNSGSNTNSVACTADDPSSDSVGDCDEEGWVYCAVITHCECPWSGDSGPDYCDASGVTEKSTNAYYVDWDNDQGDCECHGGTWITATSQCCGDDGGIYADNDCYQDHGLKVRDNGVTVSIALLANEVSSNSKLRVEIGGTNYGVGLVPTGDATASRVHVRVGGTTYALRKY